MEKIRYSGLCYCYVEKRFQLLVDPELDLEPLLDERHLMVGIFGGQVLLAFVNLVFEHVSELDAVVVMMIAAVAVGAILMMLVSVDGGRGRFFDANTAIRFTMTAMCVDLLLLMLLLQGAVEAFGEA